MPELFRRTYEGFLEQWIADKAAALDTIVEARDPLTNDIVDLSTTSYADDVRELNVVETAQEATDLLALAVRCSTTSSRREN